ncbi:MAG: pyridoxal-dependent decarboxylase [Acidiferrobacterales bacterium]|nr:pyridoxal-dependent decarboxylase [Acidiferrobacterales bacterium]
MTDENSGANHLTPDQFRQLGYQTIDLIADYMRDIESYPVRSQVGPGDIYRSFPENPPLHGKPYSEVLEEIKSVIIPGLTHWQSPSFFAYFPSHASGPSILGDLLSSGLGVQGMLWITSPACTELETLVLDWMVEICGLPGHFHSSQSGGGVIQDSASSATLCAAIAARERALNANPDAALSDLTAYITDQTHSSGEKGLKIAGFRDDQIRKVMVDEHFRMDVEHLAGRIAEDRSQNRIPTFICATIGTTSSLAIDPIREISQLANHSDIWMHVDAAYSGSAAVCPEFRYMFDGLENVNSYCFNPHKWLLTNFDCDIFYVADKSDLINALTFSPEYLRNRESSAGTVFDYSGWQISLGRRFRSLKLWCVIHHYGVEGLRAHIRSHVKLAEQFTSWIRESDDFELFQPTSLNFVCFRHRGGDNKSQQILEMLNNSGKLFLTHTVLNGQYVIRFVPGAIRTQLSHIESAWQQIQQAARS